MISCIWYSACHNNHIVETFEFLLDGGLLLMVFLYFVPCSELPYPHLK